MTCNNCGKVMTKYCPDDIKHLFNKVDWGKSFLDADAVKLMNGEKGVVCKK